MIKPSDIKNQSFKKSLFGLNKAEVESFVDTVYRAYESLYSENETLKADKEKADKELSDLRVKLFNLESEAKSASSNDSVNTASAASDEKVSATSKFFQKADEGASNVVNSGDDDEVFVGEIEDNRKPERVMIGDGEEEGDGDFEFL